MKQEVSPLGLFNTFFSSIGLLIRILILLLIWVFDKDMLKNGSWETAGRSKEEVELDWVEVNCANDTDCTFLQPLDQIEMRVITNISCSHPKIRTYRIPL